MGHSPTTFRCCGAVQLRNAHIAIVEKSKVVDYLLRSTHPANSGKARFFESLGFVVENVESLLTALRDQAHSGMVVTASESVHGEKYVVEGSMLAQTGSTSSRKVRTVWIIDRGSDVPRLVTAYPAKE
jgi:hypothetical protein